MDFFVARSMQIAGMEILQINDLHDRERKCGYCLPNWNIQSLFHLPSVRDRWMIPDDAGAQAEHAQRIRTRLLSDRIARGDSYEAVEKGGMKKTIVLAPWENVTVGRMESVHLFDAMVYDAVAAGTMSFAYEGGSSSGSRLRDRVMAGRRAADREGY